MTGDISTGALQMGGDGHSTTGTAQPSTTSRNDAMSAMLAGNWWALLLRGVLAVIFGALTLLLPLAALRSLVLLFSAYMLADGLLGIISAVRAGRAGQRWGWLVFEALLNIAAGILAFILPGIAVITFVVLASVWAIVSGVALLAAAFRLNKTHGRWLMGLAGLVSIIWGVLLLLQPVAGALVLTLWLGAYALVFGVVLIVLAFRLRSRRNGWTRVASMSP